MNPEARGAEVRLNTVINLDSEWKAKDSVVPTEETVPNITVKTFQVRIKQEWIELRLKCFRFYF